MPAKTILNVTLQPVALLPPCMTQADLIEDFYRGRTLNISIG